uniref:Chemosensory protein n=1 Tax=Leucinodes orbonalis TaxID=711050 RepID=A0AAU0QMF9_9NEOP|nr:chemosensory protein [Leucinodes orbonalis]
MKLITTLFIIITYTKIISEASETTKYTAKYDGVNLEEILANDRLLTGYVNCLLDKGPCTPDGKELKKNLPDAIQNDCVKCTERQREGADQVMEYIIDHRADDWEKLEKKFNSDGTYKKKYLERKLITHKSTEQEKSDEEEQKSQENNK